MEFFGGDLHLTGAKYNTSSSFQLLIDLPQKEKLFILSKNQQQCFQFHYPSRIKTPTVAAIENKKGKLNF